MHLGLVVIQISQIVLSWRISATRPRYRSRSRSDPILPQLDPEVSYNELQVYIEDKPEKCFHCLFYSDRCDSYMCWSQNAFGSLEKNAAFIWNDPLASDVSDRFSNACLNRSSESVWSVPQIERFHWSKVPFTKNSIGQAVPEIIEECFMQEDKDPYKILYYADYTAGRINETMLFLKKAPFVNAYIEGSLFVSGVLAVALLFTVLLVLVIVILFRDSLLQHCWPGTKNKAGSALNPAEKMIVDNARRLDRYTGDTMYYDKRNGKDSEHRNAADV